MSNFNDVTMAFQPWLELIIGERINGEYIDGRWIITSVTPLSFWAVVQNAKPEDLLTLPEGNRSDETIKLHTKFELIPQKQTTNISDKITYLNNTYLVYSVANRKIGGYYKALAIR